LVWDKKNVDPQGSLLRESIPSFDRIANAIHSGRCIPFLGAGASRAFKNWRNGQSEIPGSPSGAELKVILEAALRAKAKSNPDLSRVPLVDLPSVAEFYEFFDSGHRDDIEDNIKKVIAQTTFPRPIQWVLTAIPSIRSIFTTNYDELIELAARNVIPRRNLIGYVYDQSKTVQKKPAGIARDIVTNRKFEPPASIPPEGHPLLLYKMHGDVNHPDSMLITTYDYVRHLATWRDERAGVPKGFRDLLLTNSVLFLGYGLGDWNFRVIWEAMISAFPGGQFPIQSFAIKNNATAFERSLFNRRNIEVIDCDVTLFARALAEEFKYDIPNVPPPGGGGPGSGGGP